MAAKSLRVTLHCRLLLFLTAALLLMSSHLCLMVAYTPSSMWEEERNVLRTLANATKERVQLGFVVVVVVFK